MFIKTFSTVLGIDFDGEVRQANFVAYTTIMIIKATCYGIKLFLKCSVINVNVQKLGKRCEWNR